MFELKLRPYVLTWHNPFLNEIKKVNKLEIYIKQNGNIVYYKQGISSENDQFEFLIQQSKNFKLHDIYNSMIEFLVDNEYCELIEKSNNKHFDYITDYYLRLTTKSLLTLL